jgi:N-acyl-L-homoserine lactone synthetase
MEATMNQTSLKATRFADRVCRLLERTTYRCVSAPADKEAIFRLRYQAYMREGGIEPNATARFTDPFDDVPNVWIVAMEIDGELASSIRLHVADDIRSAMPATKVFGDVIRPRLSSGRTIVDPTRHVANLDCSKRFPELPYLTIRSAWMAGEYFEADHILAAVRTEHTNFYKRVFGHEEWSEPRAYPMLKKPIVCLSLDYQARKAEVEAKYPFYRSSDEERAALFRQSSNPLPATLACRDAPWRLKAPLLANAQI